MSQAKTSDATTVEVIPTDTRLAASPHQSHHSGARGRQEGRSKSNDRDEAPSDPDEAESDEDSDDDEPERGPWKVKVPRYMQSQGYGLQLRGKYQSLTVPSITLNGRDSTEYVALIGPWGRVVDRRKRFVTQHLLTGFYQRRLRFTASLGIGVLTGPLVESKQVPAAVVQQSLEAAYQPSQWGLVAGIATNHGSSDDASTGQSQEYTSSELRLGGLIEFGLAPRSPNYRWHGLIQGGLVFGSHESSSTRVSQSETTTTQTTEISSSTSRTSGSLGIYSAVDLIYMWQNWWWGGRTSLRTQSLTGETDGLNGALTGFSVEFVGSYTM